MTKRILIANRGAIATRIIRTIKKMGLESVAVYADADRDSLHVSLADHAIALGAGNAKDTYLDQERILTLAKQLEVSAIHPGYGFLSESAEFAERCEASGIAFVGPTPDQIRQFGLKHTAREIAQGNSVPLCPGSGLIESLDEAITIADTIAYPVMVKSTAGGGGIGMARCYDKAQLAQAYESVQRLSESNFSNSGLFIEKFIERARHIEVQIFGDGRGGVVAFGERDCSIQRRNQKVIEETPAPNLADDIRQNLIECAIALGKSVKYRSAGTVEFIYDDFSGEFYFLEVNSRLQVEHGVTEQRFGVDLVEIMISLAIGNDVQLEDLEKLKPEGYAIQARVYAEDPNKNFQPATGLLSSVQFPSNEERFLRIDHWLQSGLEISGFYDPMLAKEIAWDVTRGKAIQRLIEALGDTALWGVETNCEYLINILASDAFREGKVATSFLNTFEYHPNTFDVLDGGTQTTVQDYPGRVGYWDVGVPPSGPMDDLNFRLGNRMLGNPESAAGLECTMKGPTLRFNSATKIVLTGAEMNAELDGVSVSPNKVTDVNTGQTLVMRAVSGAGARAYVLIQGGVDCAKYLGSSATFTLGQFGGHAGRALRAGDVIHLMENVASEIALIPRALPQLQDLWNIRVTYGPHGAPDFFTEQDIDALFDVTWEVHYNSSRTGVRLIGPKPEWARDDGGEAGLHPSNIHDNAYAIGAVDFTGDMPVILGPDGPSLGGFVCPVTVIKADRWKVGQLKAGDRVRFEPVSVDGAVAIEREQLAYLKNESFDISIAKHSLRPKSAIVASDLLQSSNLSLTFRPAGDNYLLVEFGEMELDIELRFHVHALMLALNEQSIVGLRELTPGIRSLQIHYDSLSLSLNALIEQVQKTAHAIVDNDRPIVPARVVYLPLSWNDKACQLAVDKYMQLVRKDAPWCPDNIEFIRRINGLSSIEDVKRIVFDASYLVMGLGDVYLGAPVATPLDPRHRLVTTKYNPARTWTAENSVGIGGSYMCVYGMEGPGGYQFVGRTLQMWNRYRQTTEFDKPWLLRFFDQIRFFEVSHDELTQIREDFPRGDYALRIENTTFDLREYQQFLVDKQVGINSFKDQRQKAFAEELSQWRANNQFTFQSDGEATIESADESELPGNAIAVESHVAGMVWKMLVNPGDSVSVGQPLCVLESMKMEIEVTSAHDAKVKSVEKMEGSSITAGQRLLILETET